MPVFVVSTITGKAVELKDPALLIMPTGHVSPKMHQVKPPQNDSVGKGSPQTHVLPSTTSAVPPASTVPLPTLPLNCHAQPEKVVATFPPDLNRPQPGLRLLTDCKDCDLLNWLCHR